MRKLTFGIILLTLLIACADQLNTTTAEERSDEVANPISDPSVFVGKHKAKAMVLGVFHFSNPGLDTYKPKFPFDILDGKRQSELEVLLDRIAEYKPTKILLEWNRIKDDSETNMEYQQFLSGDFDISKKTNEVYQIGFKLAKKLKHDKVYCSDASAAWFGVELDWDNYDDEAYLKSKGQFEKSNRYDYQPFYVLHDSLKTIQTLTEHLAMMNNPEDRLKDHQAYLTSILEGAGDNYLGADSVARWYRRNLRIFANALDLCDFDQEERILLLYGAGHVWQLRQFLKDSPDFDYVEANAYLVDD